jgi:hypothetical protein
MAAAAKDKLKKVDTAPKVMDVAHPGKGVASASGRPIIVTNRPILKDPMMVDLPSDEQAAGAPILTRPTTTKLFIKTDDEPTDTLQTTESEGKPADVVARDVGVPEPPTDSTGTEKKAIKIEPITISEEEEEEDEPVAAPSPSADTKITVKLTDEAKSDSAPAAPAEDAPVADVTPDATAPSNDSSTSDTDTATETDDATDTATTDASTDQNKKPADDEAAAALHEKLDSIAAGQEYFLPINAVERRRNRNITTAGVMLAILLAAVWLDVAADAGFIHIPFLPLTHFFS